MSELVPHLDGLTVRRYPLAPRATALGGAVAAEIASLDHWVIHLPAGRGSVEQDVVIPLEAGDVLVLPATSPVRIVGVGVAIVARMPARDAGPYLPALRAAAGRVIGRTQATARIVGHLLVEASSAELSAFSTARERTAHHIVGLVGLMCSDGVAWASRGGLLAQAKEYIEQRLGDLELSPDSIARAQNVSTRTLHRVFETEGLTVSGWIRGRRLENCRVELVDPDLAAVPVSGIGARWGLWDAAHFSRLFKAAYGFAPSAFRAAHADDVMQAGALRSA